MIISGIAFLIDIGGRDTPMIRGREKYNNIRITLFGLLSMLFFSGDLFGVVTNKQGKYGFVARTKKIKRDMVIEKIRLYSRLVRDSKEMIVRNGHLIRHKKARATVIVSHGFMCDRHDVKFLRWLFPEAEYNVLFFDYRAHGENTDDQNCTFGRDEINDLIAATKFVKHHPYLKKNPVFVYGFSMGAVTAIEAQAQKPKLFDAMILDCPFDSSENIVKKGLERMKVTFFGYEFDVPGRGYLEKYVFHPYVQSFVKMVLRAVARMDSRNIKTTIYPVYPVESIKKVTVPCLFIHCKNDDRIPVESITAVYQGAAGYKRLWITNGRHHYDSFFYNPDKYYDTVSEFLKTVLNKSFVYQEQEGITEDIHDDIV